MDSMKELQEKQCKEREEFVNDCPHSDVKVEDCSEGFRKRSITLRCVRCRLNLVGYVIDGDLSYLSYVRDCVNGYPKS